MSWHASAGSGICSTPGEAIAAEASRHSTISITIIAITMLLLLILPLLYYDYYHRYYYYDDFLLLLVFFLRLLLLFTSPGTATPKYAE